MKISPSNALGFFAALSVAASTSLVAPRPKAGLFLESRVNASRTHEAQPVQSTPGPQWSDEWDMNEQRAEIRKWKDTSDVPRILQYLFTISWIALLTCIPFVVPMMDHRKVTKTQIILAVLTMMVVCGGSYLFTNVILFQSIHFESTRPLTMVECIYFMAQTVTTIGYGDIGPAKPRGQIFVGFYVIFSLFVIAMVIEDFTEHMIRVASEYKKKIVHDEVEHSSRTSQSSSSSHRHKDLDCLIQPPKPSARPFLNALAFFAVIDIVFIIFFTTWPGEQKTMFQAIYMSLITLGSIGFGFFTPITEGGMIFAAFSMVIGCTAMVVVIGEFTALVYQLNEYERFNKVGGKYEAMRTLKDLLGEEEEVTAAKFLQFVLIQTKKVDKDELDDILKVYQNLNPKNGAVSLMSIQEAATPRDLIVKFDKTPQERDN